MTKAVMGVLFDLDGTLYDRDAAVREVATLQHGAFAEHLGAVARERYVDRWLELDAHGLGDKRSLHAVLARELGLSDAFGERLSDHFHRTYPALGHAFPDAVTTLVELRRRGLKLALVTNGMVRSQESKLRRLGIEPLFDAVLISEREGVRKPEREIFERALSRLGVLPANALHVGDHPVADVAGSSAAGLSAIWRYVPYWPEPASQAATIHALAELIPLLDERA
jgi:putative hydrolase of the HAD superfamily